MPRNASPNKKSQKNTLYLALKERLINCIYPPGSLLNEMQLAEEFSVSRTPVREAIGRLEMDGYVRVLPKKGIYVTDISLNDVHQIFQTRIEIEPLTMKLAVPHLSMDELLMFRKRFTDEEPDLANAFRLDTAMHLFLVEHCGNRYIIEMMRKLFDDNTRIVIASKQNQVQIHNAKREHLEILNSLIQKDDPEKTAQLLRVHLETCRRAALDYFYSMQYAPLIPQTSQYMQELSKLDSLA